MPMGARRKGIVLKSAREIEIMREANVHVAEIVALMAEATKPGVSTWDLDQLARREIKKRNVEPAFLGYHGFPATVCLSINEEIVHGIPSPERVLEEGDILGIDFGVIHRGYVGDCARTVACGAISAEARRLLEVTERALEAAIAVCTPAHRLSDIGKAVQAVAEAAGFSVVRDFVGHGIGTAMHEEPQVPNYYDVPRPRMRPGLVIAIEPMVNQGTWEVEVLDDGWTAVTKDRKLSAHFEHSVAITESDPYVLSRI
jgi:methionyl aminopeptidase